MAMIQKQKIIRNISMAVSLVFALLVFLTSIHKFLLIKGILAGTMIIVGILWQIERKR
ncbi:hypothetical protein [Lactococcus allomyrinae]|uniref:hypothetical protein n=1 Tax=Lactococcus allomyrinae TaxID=2419773 RepID=UPI0013C52656|nr:hypothetical protein [Lactococcus allomyrinae]